MATSKPLSSLLQIIAAGVADIEARCESLDLQYPSLDDAPTPERQRIQAMFTEESLPIIAATHQLMATLMTSRMFFSKISGGVRRDILVEMRGITDSLSSVVWMG